MFHLFQSGFRKSLSTETALIRLVDQLLLSKLRALGVSVNHLLLFCDYLSGRGQCVNIDWYHSTRRAVTLGVPQGSILAPVLSLVFINDLPEALQRSAADIHADDTTISYSTHYWAASNGISEGLQVNIDDIINWYELVMNPNKIFACYGQTTGQEDGTILPAVTLKLY